MNRLACRAFVVVLFVIALAVAAFAAEEDSIVAVFSFGRTSGWTASGFTVGDGSYVVTSIDAVSEKSPSGKRIPVSQIVVASKWTGDVYPATVVATDELARIALLRIKTPASPSVRLVTKDVIDKAPKASYGDIVSGEEVGQRFPTTIYALDVEHKPVKYTVARMEAANACLTEIRSRDWLFLSKVTPPEKAPKAALVTKSGSGAVGVFLARVIIEGGKKPAVFYQVVPATTLATFLTKSGMHTDSLYKPSDSLARVDDAEKSFQAACVAFAAATNRLPTTAELAKRALEYRPKSTILQLLSGTSLASQGKLDEAAKSIEAALKLDSTVPGGRLELGFVCLAQSRLTEAEAGFRQAMKDDPKDTRPILALAELLMTDEEKLEECNALAKEAIRLSPNDPAGPIMLSRVLNRQKDYDGATRELKALIESAPNWSDPHYALAIVYESAGKVDFAEKEYRTVIELDSENPDAHLALVDFLIDHGKKDEAKAAIAAARELKLPAAASDALTRFEEELEGKLEKEEEPPTELAE